MNSTIFTRGTPHEIDTIGKDGQLKKRIATLTQVKYINLGIMLGKKRSETVGRNKADDQDDPRYNLGTNAHTLLRFAPEWSHNIIMENFIKYNKEVLQMYTDRHIPWYAPEWIGGVGLPSGKWGQVSELDLRLARRIKLNWKKERPVSLAHQGNSWRTWQLAERRMLPPLYTNKKSEFTEEYNRIAGIECINLLFDSDIRIHDLFVEVKKGGINKALNHNGKLWTPPKAGLPKPLELNELTFLPLYPNYVEEYNRTDMQINNIHLLD